MTTPISVKNIESSSEALTWMKELLTTSFMLVVAETTGEIIELNENFRKAFGRQATEWVLTDFRLLETDIQSIKTWEQLIIQANQLGKWCGPLCLQTVSGEYVELDATVIPFDTQLLLIFNKVSNQTEVEKWRQLACLHDLSNLPNRRSFWLEVESIVEKANQRNLKIAVLYLDIDKFKHINDTFGHSSGNQILQELGRRFKEYQDEDRYIFHLSGDEFAILQYFENHLTEKMENILSISRKPFQTTKGEIQIEMSMGASIYPVHGNDMGELLAYADSAMYVAKKYEETKVSLYKESIAHGYSTVLKEETASCMKLKHQSYLAN